MKKFKTNNNNNSSAKQILKMPTALGISNRLPNQVLTGPDVA